MDLHQMEIFLTVMESGGVTRASEKVNLTPGAVSLQVQRLSSELRTQLFVRNGRRMSPTPAAVRLADHVRRVLKQVRHIQQDFEDDPREDDRPFHFATGVTTLVYRLGIPLRKLRNQFPHCDFHVSVAPTEEIVDGLLERHLDLGLISLPVTAPHLEITPLFDEELFLLRPSPTPVPSGPITSVSPAELEGMPFLLYPKRSNMRSKIDRFLKEVGVSPRVLMEADDTEAIKRLVESGFGYSILPELALRGQRRFFHVHRIGDKRLIRKQALATARSDFPRKLTLAIANFLQTAMRVE
jgi:DNA-binding transcriptional LysR family regulator